MTNYYIGYVQGNDEYVYVGNITPTNIGISTTTETALTFDTKEIAEGILAYVNTVIANQEFKVLKITKTIEEMNTPDEINEEMVQAVAEAIVDEAIEQDKTTDEIIDKIIEEIEEV